MRAAAPHQRRRRKRRQGVQFFVEPSDYYRKVRVSKTGNLILFVVDASTSMAIERRMTATKGAILALLADAYQKRDRVGLVVFREEEARLILPPTNSVLLAHRALDEIPVGGRTPLSAGLTVAYETVELQQLLYPDVVPIMVVITDGAGNVAMTRRAPQEEAYLAARRIRAAGIRSVVFNMAPRSVDKGLARELATQMGADYFTSKELDPGRIHRAVRVRTQYVIA